MVTLRTGEIHPDAGLGVARSLGHLAVGLAAVRTERVHGATPVPVALGDSLTAVRTAGRSTARDRLVAEAGSIGGPSERLDGRDVFGVVDAAGRDIVVDDVGVCQSREVNVV